MKQTTRNRIEALGTPRARLAAGAAIVLVVAALLLNSLRPDPSETAERVGRVDRVGAGASTTLDTTPFTPARPDVTGSTTIPDGVLGTEPDLLPDSSTTTSEPNLSGTTSSVPLAGPQADPVCNAYLDVYRAVAAASKVQTSVPLLKEAVLGPLASIIQQLQDADRTEFSVAVELYGSIRSQVEKATTQDEAEGEIVRLAGGDPRSALAKAPILDHMRRECPNALIGL